MATLTVNIDQENDLRVLEEILKRFGLTYQINDESALDASLAIGLQQSENSLIKPHQQVMSLIREKFNK